MRGHDRTAEVSRLTFRPPVERPVIVSRVPETPLATFPGDLPKIARATGGQTESRLNDGIPPEGDEFFYPSSDRFTTVLQCVQLPLPSWGYTSILQHPNYRVFCIFSFAGIYLENIYLFICIFIYNLWSYNASNILSSKVHLLSGISNFKFSIFPYFRSYIPREYLLICLYIFKTPGSENFLTVKVRWLSHAP